MGAGRGEERRLWSEAVVEEGCGCGNSGMVRRALACVMASEKLSCLLVLPLPGYMSIPVTSESV